MDTIPIIKLSDTQFKFINDNMWYCVTIDCNKCKKLMITITPDEIPEIYPSNRAIVFKCKDCGEGHKRKVIFIVN